MHKSFKILGFVWLLFILQTPVNGQSIIINEISQGPSGGQEYIEFLITGPALVNCTDIPPCIDLRGWIFDDNNGYLNGGPTTGVGIAAGACRFSNDPFWSCIPAGTIIVIYNDASPNGSMPLDDINMADGNCALNIPISSALFETHTTLPSSSNGNYSTTGWVSGGNWTNISMANGQDGFQVYDPANLTTPVFSVGWGASNTNGDIYMGASSATDDVFYLTDCNSGNQASWVQGCAGDFGSCGSDDQTPGALNPGQAACIGAMNHNCNPPTVIITPVDATCAGVCDGSATAVVTGGSPAFVYSWSPAPGAGQGTATPSAMCPGPYTLTLSDDNGLGCILTTPTTIGVGVGSANAGIDGALTTCSTSGAISLFTLLTGGPDPAGTWQGPSALTNGDQGTFTPGSNIAGVYMYLVGVLPCQDTALVTVTVYTPPVAGVPNTLVTCSTSGTTDLFPLLGVTADLGGVWTPALTSGTGVLDPLTDAAGIYTYTVTGIPPCPDATATITITVNTPPVAGVPNTLVTCSTSGTTDLFPFLGATADLGGAWTPVLTSGTGVFDPLLDAAGVYTYTVSGIAPCADPTATITVTVNTPPVAGVPNTLVTCSTSGTTDLFPLLGATADLGGAWTPALTSGSGVFDPLVDAAGVYTYTVAGAAPCIDATAAITVTVNTPPVAGIPNTLVTCSTSGTTDLFPLLGATADLGGAWTPALTSGTGVFDPLVDAAGIYTYTVTGTAQCPDAIATVTVTVNTPPNAGSDGVLAICITDPSTDLFPIVAPADVGGTWQPIMSSGTGFFDPAIDLPGTYQYVVTGLPSCPNDTSDVIVSIVTIANTTIAFPPAQCEVGLPIALTAATPGGVWSGSAITDPVNGIFDPTVSGVGQSQVIYTITGGCGNADTINVQVDSTVNAGIDGSVTFCSTDPIFDLETLIQPADIGGVWSPALISGSGIIDPSVDLPGVYQYVMANAGACPNDTSDVQVVINVPPNVTISPAGSFCETDVAQNLSAVTGGGVWSGGAISDPVNGVFDPLLGIIGQNQVIYTISGVCGNSDTINVQVDSTVNAGMDAVVSFCVLDPVSDLFPLIQPADVGGTWGPALSGGPGLFNPATDAAGLYQYVMPNIGACQNDTADVVVSLVVPPIALIDPVGPFCESDIATTLTAATSGGGWIGVGVTDPVNGIFDPNIAGPGTYSIVYTIPGSCGSSDTISIVVNPEIDASVNPQSDICESVGIINFTSVNPGGTWDGNGIINVNTGAFNPSLFGPGVYTVTYTIPGSCPTSGNLTFNVLPDLIPIIAPPSAQCVDAPVVSFVADLPGGSWVGTGITNVSSGEFSPAIAGVGSFQIIYTISSTCGGADTSNITVNALPNGVTSISDSIGCPVLNVVADYSSSSTLVNCDWTVSNGITINNCGPISLSFSDPSCYDLSLTITDINGCTQTINHPSQICVIDPPVADFSYVPQTINELQPNVDFTNLSTNADNYQWDIDGSAYTSTNVSHSFPGQGHFVSCLIASNASGCSDTVCKTVLIEGVFAVYVPNSFTPDADGRNDMFSPSIYGFSPEDYEFMIFNRWGELIWETQIYGVEWDGLVLKNGITKVAQEDVYVWKLVYKKPGASLKEAKIGHVTILK